jgi:hypothetical protein
MVRRLLTGVFLTLVTILCVTALIQGKEGRWKDDGNGGCVFDPADDGPDQCTPTAGRWKLDANGGCYFDANDSGPNQCPPQAASESEIAARESQVSDTRADRGGAEQHGEVAR